MHLYGNAVELSNVVLVLVDERMEPVIIVIMPEIEICTQIRFIASMVTADPTVADLEVATSVVVVVILAAAAVEVVAAVVVIRAVLAFESK